MLPVRFSETSVEELTLTTARHGTGRHITPSRMPAGTSSCWNALEPELYILYRYLVFILVRCACTHYNTSAADRQIFLVVLLQVHHTPAVPSTVLYLVGGVALSMRACGGAGVQ